MRALVKFLGVTLLALLVAAYIGVGLSRISFNVDILRLLPTHLKQVEGLSLFLKNFALPDELIVTIDAADPEQAKSAADSIATALQGRSDLVKSAVAEAPWDNNPANLSPFLTFVLLNQPPEKIREMAKRLAPDQAVNTLQETLEELNSSVSPIKVAMLTYDPFRIFSSLMDSALSGLSGTSEFSSKDGTFRVVYVQAAAPFSDYQKTATWIKDIKALCNEAISGSGVELGFTGEPAFVAEISTDMQGDMMTSAPITLALISLIFWICYGRFLPLLGLLLMLQLIFLLTLGTAGLALNELTIAGVGFASVMIGLSVDYGYFIYQSSLTHSGTARSLQWNSLQSIVWTAGTTAAAFFALNFSSLPGLSQLGNMVGIGVCIGALVMLGLYAPLVLKFRKTLTSPQTSRLDAVVTSDRFARVGMWITLGMVVFLLGSLVFKGFPDSDFSAATFRPRKSESHAALSKLYNRLQDDRGFLSLIVSGKNESEVWQRLNRAEDALQAAKENGTARHFLSPLPLWPELTHQKANLAEIKTLSLQSSRLKSSLLDNGFTEEAFALASTVFAQSETWGNHRLPIWPSDQASSWILRRLARHDEGNYLALGIVEPSPGCESTLVKSIQGEGVHLVSWGTLGEELKQTLPREILHVSLALLAGILLILLVALRSVRAVLLFTLTTTLVLFCLAGAMSLLGMQWGFFNLAAVLLLLGTGTDYSILILLAFKRSANAIQAQKQFASVIFLCCTSSMAGFATLGLASNMGLAALGQTCALGLLIDGMISLFLLPRACQWFLKKF